jgi:uncharacterized protein (DUF1778 family)
MASANLPTNSDADKKPAVGYFTDDERRIIGLAAVEESVSRATFIAGATVEKAAAVLKEKNPSALDGTPWALPKSDAA